MEKNVIEKLSDGCLSWLDGELSVMGKDERERLYESYSWMFSDDCKVPSLESLIVGNDPRVGSFRRKFLEWFSVVCDYSLDPMHMGQTSYSHYLKSPYWKGEGKGNKVYPQRVILVLGMMGIFTGVKTNYLYVNDKTKDHGRVYIVDMDRLKDWTTSLTGPPDETYETSVTSMEPPSFESSCTDSDFDYSFLEVEDDKSWDLYDDWSSTRQGDTISSLEVIPECCEKARNFLDSSSYVKVDELGKEEKKRFRSQYRNCKWLVSLSNGKIGSCKVDDKGGRFYSMMVGLGKEYRRNCLRLDGERIVEVDVSSSQPTLIGLKVKKETGITSQWLSHCLKGDFYEWVKEMTGVKVKRDKVKKYVMRYLFSCYGPDLPKTYEGGHLPPDEKEGTQGYKRFEQRLTSYLKDYDPDIYALIEQHKRHPYWNDKVWTDKRGKKHFGKWCSGLPVEMQKVEVEYIKTCLSRLPEGLQFYTIHDSICVKESEGEMVKAVMELVSQEIYGEKISVKVENTSNE